MRNAIANAFFSLAYVARDDFQGHFIDLALVAAAILTTAE
jgi:hypothetical protein